MNDSTLSTILMLALMAVAFWFLLIRPAQKKQKAQQELVDSLTEGSRVMTTSGVFGTIRQMGDKQAIIEIAPGIEMTVIKQAIMRVVPASEEEFEYDDEDIVDLEAVDGVPGALPAPTAGAADQPWEGDAPVSETGFERPDKPENTSR